MLREKLLGLPRPAATRPFTATLRAKPQEPRPKTETARSIVMPQEKPLERPQSPATGRHTETLLERPLVLPPSPAIAQHTATPQARPPALRLPQETVRPTAMPPARLSERKNKRTSLLFLPLTCLILPYSSRRTDTTGTTRKSKKKFSYVRIDEKAVDEEMLNIYSGYDYYQTTSTYLSEKK